MLPARKPPQDFEIRPSLDAACDLRTRDAVHVARVVILAREIGHDVARYRKSRDHAFVLADGRNTSRFGLPDRARDDFGGYIRLRREPAEGGGEGAENERALGAVAGRGTRAGGEGALTPRGGECLGLGRVPGSMGRTSDPRDHARPPSR